MYFIIVIIMLINTYNTIYMIYIYVYYVIGSFCLTKIFAGLENVQNHCYHIFCLVRQSGEEFDGQCAFSLLRGRIPKGKKETRD